MSGLAPIFVGGSSAVLGVQNEFSKSGETSRDPPFKSWEAALMNRSGSTIGLEHIYLSTEMEHAKKAGYAFNIRIWILLLWHPVGTA